MTQYRRTRLEIDLGAIAHNVRCLRARTPETAKLLELPYQDIHLELANHLADFAVSYRVGSAAKKYPLKS